MQDSTAQSTAEKHVLYRLPTDDLDLIVELVLESGSLKGLAKNYSVSYPTIRSRLDRVIARLKTLIEGRPADPLSDLLGDLVERGQVTGHHAKQILEIARSASASQENTS